MFCKYCGSEIPDDAGFCPKCGKSLTDGITQQQNAVGQNEMKNNKKGMAIASLVLGIVGLIAWIIPLFGFPIAIIGLVLGIIGIKKGGKGMAIAGIVLASICLIVTTANSAIGFYMGYNGQLWFQQDDSGNNAVEKDDIQSERESKVYRVISSAKISKDDMDSIVYNLQRRADNYTTEAVVLMKERKSEWYVEISMPGVSDDAYKEVVRNVELQFIGGYGTDSEEIVVTNQNIKSASVSVVENSATGTKDYVVSIVFDDEGTKAFADGTTKFIGQKISIVLDGVVISEPYVQCAITGGEAQITSSSYEEAESLATLLRVGYIGFDLEEVE